jgi:FkbM family methyltransferase
MVELEFFLRLFSADRELVIFDIGAHHGNSVEKFICLYPKAGIYAFEPDNENYARLSMRFAGISAVRSYRVAAGRTDGHTLLHQNNYHATHSLLPFKVGEINRWADANDFQETGVVEVDQIALDTFCARNDIAGIDILKLDAQGGEMMVLEGGEEMLSKQAIKALFCEVEFRELYEGQPLFWDITGFLMSRGYHFVNIVGPKISEMGILCWADAIYVNDQLWQSIATKHSAGKVIS